MTHPKPTIRCKIHEIFVRGGHHCLDMTVLDKHVVSGAPAGTRGTSSAIQTIDFVNGICVTRNTIYTFRPTFQH